MNQSDIPIKRALISVSDKKNIISFAKNLQDLHIEILSTGGTSKILRAANIPVTDVSDITQFPEIMDGRVKTLHPKIHGGILGLRDEHASIAESHDIQWIDLVIVNLYPFEQTIKNNNATFDNAIDNIDIGGPAMIRSAAKNMGWVGVIVDPDDYSLVLHELNKKKSLSFTLRNQLAVKAFEHTAHYDLMIYNYFSKKQEKITFTLEKHADLRYGENPHQAASAYKFPNKKGILDAIKHQGKDLSYNNITDSDAAYACVREFSKPACVIVKHGNPCGVAVGDTILEAYKNAYVSDSQSAFGGIIALNQMCTKEIAEAITQLFFEVFIAPEFEADALKILATKTNLRVLEHALNQDMTHEMKFIEGGVLIQEKDLKRISINDLKIVTKQKPNQNEMDAMLFAWPIVKHIKSNAILIAQHNRTAGIGAGQVSRIDSVDIAIKKAGGKLHGAILASDAFFPFRDSIDRIAETNIRAIIQPGGSTRDKEVIAACDEQGIAMVFTGARCFKH